MKSILESVVLCSDLTIYSEINDVINHIPHIVTHHFISSKELENYLQDNTIQFIIISEPLGVLKEDISRLYELYPHVYLIYFHAALSVDSFHYSDLIFFSHIIVGEDRIKGLSRVLLQLTRDYWKKIPYGKFKLNYEKLSPRLKKVMNYIETHDLKECGTAKISEYLDISSGYFSQEFKRDTNYTFREFMQKLLDHYEFIILDSLNLPAKTASQILGYSELSSFSRSFKKRKGYPPSQRKLQKYAEN